MELKSDSLVSVAFEQHNYKGDLPFLPLSFQFISIADNKLLSDNEDSGPVFGTETSGNFLLI